MIKVIIERKVKKGEDIAHLLRELRATAMHKSGYITGETLVNTKDKSSIIVVSTWENLDAWNKWEKSKARDSLYSKIAPLLAGEAKVKIYNIAATEK